MIKKYAVFGNPIAHSKSPQIHAAFAAQFNIEQDNYRIEAGKETGEFETKIEDFFNNGGTYCNVTLPFKGQAFVFASAHGACSQRAQKAGAVNTLIFKENTWLGDNTDGIGLLTDLKKNQGLILRNKNILILGAGGATRGILAPLLNEHPAQLVIANRTVEKAVALANDFSAEGKILGCGFDYFPQEKFDIIINATSVGTKEEDNESSEFLKVLARVSALITSTAICYDLAYGAGAQLFLNWAKENGIKKSFDGLGMLVEQAAEAFALAHSKHPDTMPVIKMLREMK